MVEAEGRGHALFCAASEAPIIFYIKCWGLVGTQSVLAERELRVTDCGWAGGFEEDSQGDAPVAQRRKGGTAAQHGHQSDGQIPWRGG